jgi:hypothetical protein
MHPRRPGERTLLPSFRNISTSPMHHDLLRFGTKREDCVDGVVAALEV